MVPEISPRFFVQLHILNFQSQIGKILIFEKDNAKKLRFFEESQCKELDLQLLLGKKSNSFGKKIHCQS
jgi:hypothetical protein